jgi:hypothetical protein
MLSENVKFEFNVFVHEPIGYSERKEFLKELENTPEFKVEAFLGSAGSEGGEMWLFTIITAVANIATIAEVIHKYFKKKRKKTPENIDSLEAYVEITHKIVLNDMTKEQLAKIIETLGSYELLGSVSPKILNETKEKMKRLAKKNRARKKMA